MQPDLQSVYGVHSDNPNQPPVVLIHGSLGSRLKDSIAAKEVWPGSLRQLLFSSYLQLGLDIDPHTLLPKPSNLKTAGIAESAGGQDFYGRIMETLESVGHYQRAEPGTPASMGAKRYYVFEYDWRQDNVQSARRLHEFIESIRSDYHNPELKVDVVAHSMGGLITRYYARYGTQDVLNDNEFPVNLEGENSLRRVIILGTPNLGAHSSLRILLRGYKVVFGSVPPEIAATFPSTYQVLPHAIAQSYIDLAGEPVSLDHFSVEEFWKRFQFSIFKPEIEQRIRSKYGSNASEADRYLATLKNYFNKHLERGRRFSWSLTVPVPQSQMKYIVFGGDCVRTPARAVVERDGVEFHLRLRPSEIKNPQAGVDYESLMYAPGDGTVTKSSLLARQSSDPSQERHQYSNFAVDYPIFLCEDHGQLTGNLDFQNNLLHALLSADR